jgi:hypothetical protein
MNRITEKMLRTKIDYLNDITNSPKTAWTRQTDGSLKANIGNYHLYQCLGIVALESIMNEGGGVHRILTGSTKRELFNLLNAYIAGYLESIVSKAVSEVNHG